LTRSLFRGGARLLILPIRTGNLPHIARLVAWSRTHEEDALRSFVPLPLVSGYPDTNKIVCGATQSLGRFAVVGARP
jgi:hypothetical protein